MHILEKRRYFMQQLTGAGLAAFARAQVGMPYFYGAKISHGILTEEFMEAMHQKFPRLVSDTYLLQARENGQVGKINVDCSGLIGAYRGRERGSSQLYATAYVRMPIGRIKDFAVGTVLWKKGHVGVYIGKNNGIASCVEAKGVNYGTIISKVEDTEWERGLTFSDISYEYRKKVPGTWKDENPYLEPAVPVLEPRRAGWFPGWKTVSFGEGVRWLQWELKEAGYELAVDGVFGENTRQVLTAFQTSCELEPDGIAGAVTKAYLTVNDTKN